MQTMRKVENMTFEDLLTENRTKPQLVEFLTDELSEHGAYWQSCAEFFLDNRHELVGQMSPKQAAWADKISEDVLEKYLMKGQK